MRDDTNHALEFIDAAVMSGDEFHDPDLRKEFREYIERWFRSCNKQDEIDKIEAAEALDQSDEHEDFEGTWLEYLKEFYRRTQGDFDDWSDGIKAQKLMDSPYFLDVEVSHGEMQGRYEPSTKWISTTGDKAYSYYDCIDEPPFHEWNDKKRTWRVPKNAV